MPLSKLATSLAALIALGACSATMQTTSGSDYLARYNDSHASPAGTYGDVDADVRRIASIEPTLEFPARIGLARIDRGRLSTIPGDEGKIWATVAQEIGPSYGEFIPISPMIASMVAEPAPVGLDHAGALISNIRRGAARQHVDYVVAYEVSSTTQNKANSLSLADLTIIGMFVLPTREIEVEATASALMLDVRTGYPYATLTAHAEKSGVSRVVSEWSTGIEYADTAEERAVANLAGEFQGAIEELAFQAETMTSAPPASASYTRDPSPTEQALARVEP